MHQAMAYYSVFINGTKVLINLTFLQLTEINNQYMSMVSGLN